MRHLGMQKSDEVRRELLPFCLTDGANAVKIVDFKREATPKRLKTHNFAAKTQTRTQYIRTECTQAVCTIPQARMTLYRKTSAILLLLLLSCLPLVAQRVAVKTNLLYDAALTPNIGVELGIGRKSTLQGYYSLNLWNNTPHRNKQFKHWQALGEYRWWPCSKMNGHFVGVHVMGGEFNMKRVHFKLPFYNWPADLKEKRYEGWNVGAGFTYGYQWMLSRHWNLEASIGVGYQRFEYKKFPCEDCGTMEEKGHKNYFGPDKAVIAIMYVF